MSTIKLLQLLADIQDMCIGEIAMGYNLDAEHIGKLITDTVGLTNQEIKEYIAANLVE